MFLFIDPPLRPSKEGNFRYSIFFNLLAIIVYRQTLNSIQDLVGLFYDFILAS
jgi:hypothetical protein